MSRNILVVDDMPHIVRLIQVNLERHGYQVTVAHNGRDCLSRIDTAQPDLIILDILMPEMDGWEVLENLRTRSDSSSKIPVIILTNLKDDKDAFRCFALGAKRYLTKPFNPLELSTIVRQVLEEDNQPPYQL